jgi:uracil-DNA glycosylase family 4
MRDNHLSLERAIVSCERCPRLRAWCTDVAQVRRRAYRDQEYWGRPVPGFGDKKARLFLLGLAPGAHGANRTGRVFTGDSSGDFLFRALYRAGFANQPASVRRNDGLALAGCWVSASVRCAPPDNKPTTEEVLACRPFLERELALFPRLKALVALGRLAFDNLLDYYALPRTGYDFAHDRLHDLGPGRPALISSYHPSRQNTQTGRLTEEMFQRVFTRARNLLDATDSP